MYRLCILGEKGFSLLKGVLKVIEPKEIFVEIGNDKNISNDSSEAIYAFCIEKKIKILNGQYNQNYEYTIAAGWQKIIHDTSEDRLIVIHDSLLPKYRGFNPLVTALINGDKEIGVTAIIASKNYDEGPIIEQLTMNIRYPLKIEEAITQVAELYCELGQIILKKIITKKIKTYMQDETLASYSLWRDQNDYYIDFNKDSFSIKRQIDATGKPYDGAKTLLNGEMVLINDAEVIDDLKIENRVPGKVIFIENNQPTVVCGEGLLKITDFKNKHNEIIKMNKFRSRFGNDKV